MKCPEKISLVRQQEIHHNFWKIEDRDERLQWIFGSIEQKEVAVHRASSSGDTTKQRNFTRVYKLLDSGAYKTVCKQFFLHTLGYKHDTILTKLFKSMTPSKIRPPSDQRGKHLPKHAFTPEVIALIDAHIESFHPQTSHYRRAHAPLRRYLAPELTITFMSKLFEEAHPGVSSRRSYSRRIKLKNISFCKLGEEEHAKQYCSIRVQIRNLHLLTKMTLTYWQQVYLMMIQNWRAAWQMLLLGTSGILKMM